MLCALIVAAAGCAPLTQTVVSVEGAGSETSGPVVRIAVDTGHPVVLHAVDEKRLPGIQVSSKVRAYTYALQPGRHVLWVSSAPYGLPFVPQRLKCYVIDASLSAGSTYTLRFDVPGQVPVLAHSAGAEPDVTGALVDEPLVLERGCRWR